MGAEGSWSGPGHPGARVTGDTLVEARRQMVICNACRYCEGLCAVFPALERRRAFEDADLAFLANLCHDCGGCLDACQYAPPHEFGVDVPRVLAQLRVDTYREAAWPRFLGGLLDGRGHASSLVATAVTLAVVLLGLLAPDPDVLFARHVGAGAFYDVVPYPLMVWPASVVGLWALVALAAGAVRHWQATGGGAVSPPSLAAATWDALRLTYLGGHAEVCDAPEAPDSTARRRFHHMVFYGFCLTFLSTTVAAGYHHLLGREAPYPLLSVPVLLGTVGGVALVLGTTGLLVLGSRSARRTTRPGRGLDVALLVWLNLTNITGLALLALRGTTLMGTLLVLHLGVVAGLFVTLPYSKLVHAGYRFLALLRAAEEEAREPGGGAR